MKKKRLLLLLMSVACCWLSFSVGAQQRQGSGKASKAAAATSKPTAVLVSVTLGNSTVNDSVMTPEEFNRRVKEGLKVADPRFAGAAMEGFDFTYMERNIYEDSVGNFIPVVDVLTERCPGDTLTPVAISAMSYRAKHGDTALFNNIRMRLPDGRLGIGREFKIVLQNKK